MFHIVKEEYQETALRSPCSQTFNRITKQHAKREDIYKLQVLNNASGIAPQWFYHWKGHLPDSFKKKGWVQKSILSAQSKF